MHKRLRKERERLGMTQEEFGDLGGVKRNAQKNYELGDRFPNAKYLSALAEHGVDVAYVLTGVRSLNTQALTPAQEALFYQCVQDVEDWLAKNKKTLSDQQIVKVSLQYYQARAKQEIDNDQVALDLVLKTAVNL